MTKNASDSDALDSGSLFLRSEIVGLSAGVAALIPALLPRSWVMLFFSESLLTLFTLLLFGSMAGALVSAFINWSKIPPNLTKGMSARLGVRAGAFVVLVGGGMSVIVASILAIGRNEIGLPETEPLLVVLVVALSAIPVIFLSSLSCIFVTTIQVPRERRVLAMPLEESSPATSRRTILLPYVLGFTSLALCSTAIPYLVPESRESKPVVAAKPPPPTLEEPPGDSPDESATEEPKAHAVQPFSYERPGSMDMAEPSRWKIADRQQLPGDFSESLLALAPDGRHLTLSSTSGPECTITVYDLDQLEAVAELDEIPTPRFLTWSPGSTHLFSVRQDGSTSAIVATTAQELPLPKAAHLPKGQPWWWYGSEILFNDGQRFHAWLDIDKLRAGEIESSAKWQSRVALGTAPAALPEATLPNTTRSRLSIVPMITRYMSPQYQQPGWEIEWTATLTVEDRLAPRIHAFKEIDLIQGDRVVAAADCSKLIRVRDGVAEVFYFAVDSERLPSAYKVSAPKLPETDSHPHFLEHLRTQTISVFICPPLINPLNSQVVGPDRERVKGIARLLSWEGEEAVVWLAESYAEIQDGDIAAEP
ncbi:MAG: hypothetical protein AAF497_04695, partial [Planctomycetota bacterium]